MGFIVGTMSVATGWETSSVPEALSRHITYWFQSRRNQGKVMGGVPSFYFLWKQHGETPERLIEKTKLELEAYVKELFPVCSVEVTRESISELGSTYTLIIAVRVTVKNENYDLADAILVTGSKYTLLDQARIKS